jgi:outer membrane protein OmpA-like peptidoglycan-associated protein
MIHKKYQAMKTRLPLLMILLFSVSVFSQKKSELFAEIDRLKLQISDVQQELAKAKREISASNARAETLEVENLSLRDANATLLGNMGNFSQLSKQSSDNVNRAMAALARKEKQLSGINDMISDNDSTAVVTLTRAKQVLGENANVGIGEGEIVVANKLDALFGSDTSIELSEEGKASLSNLAKLIQANPSLGIQVEGLNITGEFTTSYDQVTAVSKELVGTLGIPAEKINLSVRDGNFREGINIRLMPDYKGFYVKAKEAAKAAQ